MRLRSTTTALAAATLLCGLATVPAHAQEVRTLSGPVTGDPDVFLTYVGCEQMLAGAQAPRSRLNLGPYASPMGRRSLGLVPAASGSASGPLARFSSLADVDTSVSVAATAGGSGVSYLLAITTSSPPGTAWQGRAPLTVAPGSWTTFSPADLTYQWTLIDLDSRAPVSRAGAATPAAFTAQHGDGAGYAVTGFGCDGKPFNVDAVRAGGTTFDFEGLALATSISTGRDQVPAGGSVTVSGRVTDAAKRTTGDPLVLQSRVPGGEWAPVDQPVLADPDGVSRTEVTLEETAELRWHRPQSQYADEGWSAVLRVRVEAPAPEPPADGAKTDGAKTDGAKTDGAKTDGASKG